MDEQPGCKKTFPQCERCWITENSKWEADSMTSDGEMVIKLVSVLVPTAVLPGEINVCCTCGDLTVVGLYVSKDPNEVEFDVDPDDILRKD